MPCRTGETRERSQRLAVVGVHEVLHHLDSDLCCRSGTSKVFCLHHHPANCFDEEGTGLYRLGSPCCDLGFLLHHLPRYTAVLPAGPLDLVTNVDN